MAKPGQSRVGRENRQGRRRPEEKTPDTPAGIRSTGPLEPATNDHAHAVHLFGLATRALQKHDYRTALTQLDDLIHRFPSESALLDRARVYRALCERSLARPTARRPETIEERLTAATAALNNGDEDVAERLLALVLEEESDRELAYYLLAVVHARRGMTASALEALDRAIDLNPEIRAQVMYDADFEDLRASPVFQQVLSRPGARSGTRRTPGSSSEWNE